MCRFLLTSVCPPRTRTFAKYFISLYCRSAPTPLHYILSIRTRYRRYAPLPLRANSAARLSLCAHRYALRAGAAHPVLSTLLPLVGYLSLLCPGLFTWMSYTILDDCSLCSFVF